MEAERPNPRRSRGPTVRPQLKTTAITANSWAEQGLACGCSATSLRRTQRLRGCSNLLLASALDRSAHFNFRSLRIPGMPASEHP